MKKIHPVTLLIAGALFLTACGQKGPLIVEEPLEEKIVVQEEEQSPVK